MVAYNDRIAARFLQATLLWGVLGLLAGLYTYIERLHWQANADLAWITFGRLQIVHTTLLVYAWAANAFFAGLYYALQRLCQTRIWSDRLAAIHLWGWQLLMISAVITLSLGINQGRPLAEMEWPLDALQFILWLLLGLNVGLTLRFRRIKYLYVAIWFFLAALLIFPLVHLVNALGFPMVAGKSYPLFPGVADALLQAWFEQNLNSFLLTVPFVGLMYYFVPKESGQPVYSFRLAVVQFWTLIAVSAWLAPRALLYTSLPEWLQSLGVVAGLILLAPSWGGAVNGLLTLGRERKPTLLFFGLACVSYGIHALLSAAGSFKSINVLVQYTDWMESQQQWLLFGWVGSLVWGMAYAMVPKLWGRPLHSPMLARVHWALHLLSLLLLTIPHSLGGLVQGLMWFARYEDGLLIYPQFMTTFKFFRTIQSLQIAGYGLLLVGVILGVVNFLKTTREATLQDETNPGSAGEDQEELRLVPLCLGIVGIVLLGSLVELLPLLLPKTTPEGTSKPYSALVILGRDLYVREGCNSCHTQVVRSTLKEELRYGPTAQAFEYQFQGPTLWGQKRNGPDLHRVGGKYPDLWHYQHLVNPRQTLADSTMPAYPWLLKKKLKSRLFPTDTWLPEAQKIQGNLAQAGIAVDADVELLAVIAYLQKLGTDGKL